MSITTQFWTSLETINAELRGSLSTAEEFGQDDAIEGFIALVEDASRVFVLGAGRSGLALRMTAMRLMHLGLDVHVVGEVTAPAIEASDVLMTASGSGSTSGIVRAAQVAAEAGAHNAVITATSGSPLAQLASALVVVPAPQKQDHGSNHSAQYAGSLFEQTVMLIGDALFQTLWLRSGKSSEELWTRHTNIE